MKQVMKKLSNLINGAVEVPDVQFFAKQEMNNRFTPDLMSLERSVYQRIFVPCNMMLGYPDHEIIKDRSEFRAHAFTAQHFSMWRNNEHNFPVILQPRDPLTSNHWSIQNQMIDRLNHHAIIKGQLFKVMSSHFPSVDTAMRRGEFFNRIRIPIDIPLRDVVYFGEKGVETQARRINRVDAWMYVGLPDHWDKEIDGGYEYSPVKMFKPPASGEIQQPYYFYTRTEF